MVNVTIYTIHTDPMGIVIVTTNQPWFQRFQNHQPVIITRQFFFSRNSPALRWTKNIGVECGTHRMSIHKIIEKFLALFGLQITIYGQLLGVEMLPISTNLWSTTMQWCSSKCLFQNSAVILLGHPALIKRLFCRDCNAWLPTVWWAFIVSRQFMAQKVDRYDRTHQLCPPHCPKQNRTVWVVTTSSTNIAPALTPPGASHRSTLWRWC